MILQELCLITTSMRNRPSSAEEKMIIKLDASKHCPGHEMYRIVHEVFNGYRHSHASQKKLSCACPPASKFRIDYSGRAGDKETRVRNRALALVGTRYWFMEASRVLIYSFPHIDPTTVSTSWMDKS
ncbi:hypothetical protein Vi05172_g7218 [Venturia inaequalis]|nr:hypothetical protein Vi05172_g7218 [Venturia inaequalis]